VRKLIRKTLREGISQGISMKPDWVDKLNNFSREEKIEFINKYKEQVEKLLPKIILYFKAKLGRTIIWVWNLKMVFIPLREIK
jgi:hypothetical protein